MTYGRRHVYLFKLDTLSHPSILYTVLERQLCILIIFRVRETRPQPPPFHGLIPSTHLELRHPALCGLLRC
jgi:hypothetical protein